jgi:hypothetical protein
MSSPEEIQRNIEQTRDSLSNDVNRLGEKVSPPRVVARRVERLKGAATTVKERVMGSPESDSSSAVRAIGDSVNAGASSTRDAAGKVASTVREAASSVGDAAATAPQTVRRQTQGNPLAAGVVAFGIGWLIASLPPATQREQQAATLAQDKAGDFAEPLKETAQEVAANLQRPLQHSAQEIKSAATDAATETADQAKAAAAEVREPLQQ